VPRYFFDVHDGHTVRDNEGTEYAGPQEAAQHAKRLLPEIAAHEVPAEASTKPLRCW